MFLVTTLSEEVSTAALHYYIQTAFESTPSVLMVASLFRYGKHAYYNTLAASMLYLYSACSTHRE